MELQLKVELTDEQYQTLMTKSIDAIVDSPEAVAAMQQTISDNLGQYLKAHPDIIKEQFKDHNAYGWDMGTNEMTKKIISDAAAKAAETVRTAVTEYMLEVAKTEDLEAIVQNILIRAILQGAVTGLDQWKDFIGTNMLHLSAKIQNIADRLGISSSEM